MALSESPFEPFHSLAFAPAGESPEFAWLVQEIRDGRWLQEATLDVAGALRHARERMVHPQTSASPRDDQPLDLAAQLMKAYEPPMNTDDLRAWFLDGVRLRASTGDPTEAIEALLRHATTCSDCPSTMDWTLQSQDTAEGCHHLPRALREAARNEAETLCRRSSAGSGGPFCNARLLAALHRLDCKRCTEAFDGKGEPVDWRCPWATVIAHASAGLDLDRLHSASEPPPRPQQTAYPRAAPATPGSTHAVDRAKADGLTATGHARRIGSFKLEGGDGRRLRFAPNDRIPQDRYWVSPSFVTTRKAWLLPHHHGPDDDAFENDTKGVLRRARDTTGKQRLVVDYSDLNERFKDLPMSLRRLDERAEKWPDGAFLAVVDVQGAFTRAPLHPRFHKLLAFSVTDEEPTTATVYEAHHWAFGHKLSPYMFALIGAATVHLINRLFTRAGLPPSLDIYVDDAIMAASTEAATARQLELVSRWLPMLGLPIALDKVSKPATKVTYLGRNITTTPVVQIRVPPEKKLQLIRVFQHVLDDRECSVGAFSALVGVLTNLAYDCTDAYGVSRAMGYAIWRGINPLGTRPHWPPGKAMRLSTARWGKVADHALKYMMTRFVEDPVRPRLRLDEELLTSPLPGFAWLAMSDASDTGCGGLIGNLLTRSWTPWHAALDETAPVPPGTTPPKLSEASSTVREFAGMISTLELVARTKPKTTGHVPLLFVCDNRALVYCTNKRAANKRTVGETLTLILRKAEHEGLVLIACHAPRETLSRADDLSRTFPWRKRLPAIAVADSPTTVARRWAKDFDLPLSYGPSNDHG
jgi:hypothetical protein